VTGTGSGAGAADVRRERSAELGAIEHAVGDAVAGDGRLLIFEGPAGIGKSSLVGGLMLPTGRAAASTPTLVVPIRDESPGDRDPHPLGARRGSTRDDVGR
jgi:hypothetical protein